VIERFKPEPQVGLVRYCEVCRKNFRTRAEFEMGCEKCKDARPQDPVWLKTHELR